MKKSLSILFFTLLTQCTLHSQWVQQTVPVSKPIQGIKFINNFKGWAVASAVAFDTAYIIHTSNSGTTWLVQYTSPNALYLAISVVDSNIIYAGGGDIASTANLTKSTNGGLNWSVIPTPTNMSIVDMQFLNRDSGCTVGGSVGPDVRTTTNGGLNWTVRTSGIATQTQRIFFLNYNTGFCAANFSLYKTTNAGVSWIINGNFSTMVQSVYFLNINTGWAGLSPSGSSARVGYTTNGGSNWVIQNLDPYNFNINDIYFINNQTGWAGIDFNKIYKTTNAGINWGYQNNSTGSNRICIMDSVTGWTGDFGVSHTTNGGGTITYDEISQIGFVIPKQYCLSQNYPNPFNPNTTIIIKLPKRDNVKLIVYDVLGKEVETLIDRELIAGTYTVEWNASKRSSGIYIYKLISTNYTDTKKMVLIK